MFLTWRAVSVVRDVLRRSIPNSLSLRQDSLGKLWANPKSRFTSIYTHRPCDLGVAVPLAVSPENPGFRQSLSLHGNWNRTKTNRTRRDGRALVGEQLVEKVPCGRRQMTTFLGTLRAEGFVAPLTIDGPLNGPLFRAWVNNI